MSLYNMMFGVNSMADMLLETLGLIREDVGRFRDAYLKDGPDGVEIHVYTRNGGGNREEYQGTMDRLSNVPGWLGDEDDEFDSTYATIRFRVPEQHREALTGFARSADSPDQSRRWQDMLEKLRDPSSPEAVRAAEVMRPVLEQISEALKSEGG